MSGVRSSSRGGLLRRLVNLPAALRKLQSFEPPQQILYEYFKTSRRSAALRSGRLVVQCVEDLYYFGLFGQIACSLNERRPIRIDQLIHRSLVFGESESPWAFFKRRLLGSVSERKWVRLYGAFCDGVAYRSTSFRVVGDAIDLWLSWKLWRSLQTREDLLRSRVNGIAVGDLVNDSYLRFKPSPTVDLQSPYLWVLLWQVHRDIRRGREYFLRTRPELYLTSFATYLQHGVAARVALQCGVQVYSFGNLQELAKKLTLDDWLHTKDTTGYTRDFAALGGEEQKLAFAEAALSARIAGSIDDATAYMRVSAYAESAEQVPDVRGRVVVFLHDFYDSPHVYRDVVFPDFWEWACFTIETLSGAAIPFVVKPHPNQIVISEEVFTTLKTRYPKALFISPRITNKQLADAGLACGVTVHGTVAHEMAYLGIPTIGCAAHPHISFDFCTTAKTKEEYGDALRRSLEIRFDKRRMRRQSLIFYYMHNLNAAREVQALQRAHRDLRNASGDANAPGEAALAVVRRISRMAMFEENISTWAKLLGGDESTEGLSCGVNSTLA